MFPRFLLAKYVPDMARMEPRNIGVIVWWKGALRSQFLTASDATSFVNDDATYERWVEFWNRSIAGQSIRPKRGRPVSIDDAACLDALQSTEKGNYLLVDAGELLQRIKKRDLESATEYLFEDLVAIRESRITDRQQSLASMCDHLISEVGLDVAARKEIECTWHGVSRHLHPDYYVGNGHPDAILQRAKLSSEASINNAAHLVDILLDQGIVQEDRCRVLVRSGDMASKTAEEGLALFDRMCGVVDVESKDAVEDLAALRDSLSDQLTVSQSLADDS